MIKNKGLRYEILNNSDLHFLQVDDFRFDRIGNAGARARVTFDTDAVNGCEFRLIGDLTQHLSITATDTRRTV